MKVFSVILAIVGSVIGSGFISGKEVAVFFARFGYWSLPCLFFVFFLFWGVFYLILAKSDAIIEKTKNSKLFFLFNLILSIIFSSAMFAGVDNLLSFNSFYLNFLIFIAVILVCLLILKRGAKILNKVNLIFVPIMIILFLLLLSSKSSFTLPLYESEISGWSFFYSIMYVALNTSNGCVMIASLGQGLTNRQKARVGFISALVLMLILMFVNIILLQHPMALSLEMPLLMLFDGYQGLAMKIIIAVGCSTTLFSLIYTSSFLVRGLCNNEFLNFVISIILPSLLSLLGFGFIVTYLYPTASIMGIFVLFDLIFLKNSDKKIKLKPRKGL